MEFEHAQLLQSLRGSQPVILLAFLLVREAMTVKDLQGCTGLSDDALRTALNALKGKGLLVTQCGEHGRVTWLPGGASLFAKLAQSPTMSDSGARSSCSSNMVLKSLPLQQQQQQRRQSPKFTDSAAVDPKVLAALDAAKIREPKRGELARLPHVTAQLIVAHVATCESLGTAIYRIANDWPAPARKAAKPDRVSWVCPDCHSRPCMCDEHDFECTCVVCQRERPEKFCKGSVVSHRGRSMQSEYECGQLVVPGQIYCSKHLEKESED